MKKIHFCFAFILVLALTVLPKTLVWAQGPEDNPDPLLTELSLSLYEWNPGQSGDLTIKLKLPKGYHAYEDMFRLTLLEPDGFKMAAFKLKPVHEFYDKFTKKNRRGVEETGTMVAHIEAPLEFKRIRQSFCLSSPIKRVQTPSVSSR